MLIKVPNLDFTADDFEPDGRTLSDLWVPTRNIFVNHPQQVERLLSLGGDLDGYAVRERAKFLFLDEDYYLQGMENGEFQDFNGVLLESGDIATTANVLSQRRQKPVTKVIISHNHPSGVVQHSPTDHTTFPLLSESLSQAGIELVDSYVVGAEGVPDQTEIVRLHQELMASLHTKSTPKKLLTRFRSSTRKALRELTNARTNYVRHSEVMGFERLSKTENCCNGI